MRRILGIMLAVTVALGATACGKSAGGSAKGAAAGTPTGTETSAPAAAGAEKSASADEGTGQSALADTGTEPELVIQLGHIDPATNDPYQMLAELFAGKVKELSGGTIQIDILSDAQLGSEASMIEGMKLGTIDCAIISNFSYSSNIPEFCTFDMPYLFTSEKQAHAVMDSQDITGDLIQKLYDEYDVKILAYAEGGFRSVINTKCAVNTPEDLKSMKIRVPGNETYLATFSALGSNPVSMASSECYTGLQQGTIDGLEQPIGPMYSYKSYEVCKYISLTEHLYNPISLTVSRSLWESLSEEQKGWILEAAEYARDTERAQVPELNEKLLKAMVEEKGIEVNEIEDKEAFRKAVQPVYDEYTAKYGSERLDKINALIDSLK